MKIAISTLGCRVNQSDSASIESLLSSAGYDIVAHNEAADIYIINTCTVTRRSDVQSRRLIRHALAENPLARIVVTGCYATTSPEEIRKKETVDIIFSNSEKKNILEIIGRLTGNSDPAHGGKPALGGKGVAAKSRFRTRVNVKIQDGCDNHCSYCIVPRARGVSVSIAPGRVMENIRLLEDEDVKEIVLTGIHLASYGKEFGLNFADILQMVLEKSSIPRVRISSLHPDEIDERLLELFMDERVCRHFHLSIQSADDRVLSAMNRSYDSMLVRNIVDTIARKIPGAAIGGDIIAGFPGETDLEFENTLSVLEEIPVSYLHIFPFSRREGTAAYRMKELPFQVLRQRAAKLRELVVKKQEFFLRSQLGTTQTVLFEKNDFNYISGYSDNYVKVLLEVLRPERFNNRLVKVVPMEVENGYVSARLSEKHPHGA